MENKKYKLRYLPLFKQDLNNVYKYISENLNNINAADHLMDNVERVILKRLDYPLSFEPFPTKIKRRNPYYRIYVDNYTIFYVVIENVMEVRRIVYSKRNMSEIALPSD